MRFRAIFFLCLLGIIPFAERARAQGVEVTAQVKVKYTGSARASENHANDGVVLWLIPVNPSNPPAPAQPVAKPHYELAQKNKRFVPHLLVVPTGSVVEFPNLDPFFHNVFSYFNGRRFDLGLYESGSTRGVRFDRSGVSYIFCNIHPEMSAVIVSVPTRWFGISSAAGAVAIPDVAPGTYDLHVWALGSSDASLAALSQRVSITGTTVDLGTLSIEEAPVGPHKNKFGEDYDESRPSSY
jgi:plastocyanin